MGLEIGTSKICVAVGDVKPDGTIKILGVGQARSNGVRKGEIVDFDPAQTCLQDALVRAEDRSDVMIKKVILAVTGPHIESRNSRGIFAIPDVQSEITEEDVDEVKELASEVAIPQENIFIHRIIRHYLVDGQEKVQNPVGMLGKQLEADYHIVHGIRTRVQNTIRCLREFPLDVEDVVFSPIASAQVVLNREAREQGAMLLDIGGGTTDYVVYDDGAILHSGSIGVGGDHVTNDISIVLKVPLSRAERLKTEHGSCSLLAPGQQEMLQLEGDATFNSKTVDRGLLNEVIRSRLAETFQLVKKRVKSGGTLARLAGGLYLTGGTSLMNGIADLAEEVFELPVRRSSFTPMSGLSANFESPQFATPIGLIRYAQKLEAERATLSAFSRFKGRVGGIFGASRLLNAIFS